MIQHIYDSHFEGVEEVEGMIESWKRLEGKVDDKVFSAACSGLTGSWITHGSGEIR